MALVLVFSGLTAILQAFLWETMWLLPGGAAFAALAVLTKTEVISLVSGLFYLMRHCPLSFRLSATRQLKVRILDGSTASSF